MRALIIGYGSIGKRHARVLAEEGCEVALVTAQADVPHPAYRSIAEALSAHGPEYVVIASITSKHAEDLEALSAAGFTGTALVEKPVFAHMPARTPSYPFTVLVAYNLRFHPIIRALAHALQGKQVLFAHAYVGQHLSQWRAGRSSTASYSAHKAQGGGVVRDLSHELDLAQHLFGALTLEAAHVARIGEVTVDSEDTASFMLSTAQVPMLTVHMNYLDAVATRRWHIVTTDTTFTADLIAGTLTIGGEVTRIEATGDDSYRAMHRAVMAGAHETVCSLNEALAIVALADKVAP